MVPPRGYMNCQILPAGFYNGVWTNERRVCHYPRNRGVWVSGFWECSKYSSHKNKCKHWQWVPSHWEAKPAVAYAPPRTVVITQPTPPPSRVIVTPPAPVSPPPARVVITPPAPQPAPTRVVMTPPPPAPSQVVVTPPAPIVTTAQPVVHVSG